MQNLQLNLSVEKYNSLCEIAEARHIAIDEAILLAINKWITQETKHSQSRLLLQELGNGYGEDDESIINNSYLHDRILYGKL